MLLKHIDFMLYNISTRPGCEIDLYPGLSALYPKDLWVTGKLEISLKEHLINEFYKEVSCYLY